MTETTSERERDDSRPEEGRSVATLDWVVRQVNGQVMDVDASNEPAVMGAAWALGFAGATRDEVWWVLRDARLRGAFMSICHALTRVRPVEVPDWWAPLMDMPPAERAAIAREAQEGIEREVNRINGGTSLAAALESHPDAVMAPDRTFLVVPPGVLEALVALARSITASDIARLLDRARSPFEMRLQEAAAVAAEQGATFHTRRTPRSAA